MIVHPLLIYIANNLLQMIVHKFPHVRVRSPSSIHPKRTTLVGITGIPSANRIFARITFFRYYAAE